MKNGYPPRPDWADNFDWLKAVVFDLDGTLYSPSQVRNRVVRRAVAENWRHPGELVRIASVLRVYRKAQKQLRNGEPSSDLEDALVQWTASETGSPAPMVRAIVHRWMEQEPLPVMFGSRRPGIDELLATLKNRGIKRAVLSDYPVVGRLEAMGLADWFDLAISSRDPEVQRFKPHPLGLQVALKRLGIAPDAALYIGDRPMVDAITAMRAGVRCVIVTPHTGPKTVRAPYWSTDFATLGDALTGHAGEALRSLPAGAGA
ncbi:MAG: HAD family hydrolase [Bryobacteraceae bacterium]